MSWLSRRERALVESDLTTGDSPELEALKSGLSQACRDTRRLDLCIGVCSACPIGKLRRRWRIPPL